MANSTLAPLAPASEFTLCRDRLLQDLNIRFWTDVPIAGSFAAHALASYITLEHCIAGSFHPTLFIDDLILCKQRFCSRLLLNSVMYYACVSIPTAPSSSTLYSSHETSIHQPSSSNSIRREVISERNQTRFP